MKTLVVLVLFIGMFFVIQGVYEQKLKEATENKEIEYKFIPRTYYEEQIQNSDFAANTAQLFNSSSAGPWIGDVATNKSKQQN
jgi:hypothetical protein